jgi:hypothetical protein
MQLIALDMGIVTCGVEQEQRFSHGHQSTVTGESA